MAFKEIQPTKVIDDTNRSKRPEILKGVNFSNFIRKKPNSTEDASATFRNFAFHSEPSGSRFVKI